MGRLQQVVDQCRNISGDPEARACVCVCVCAQLLMFAKRPRSRGVARRDGLSCLRVAAFASLLALCLRQRMRTSPDGTTCFGRLFRKKDAALQCMRATVAYVCRFAFHGSIGATSQLAAHALPVAALQQYRFTCLLCGCALA